MRDNLDIEEAPPDSHIKTVLPSPPCYHRRLNSIMPQLNSAAIACPSSLDTRPSPFAILKPVDDIKNAVACIIGRAVRQIRRFVSAIHNRCPLVVYENAKGSVCSQFVKRDAFQGYHIDFNNGRGVVTNLATGKQYQVQLTGSYYYCQCKSFKYAPLPKQPCRHLKMVADLQGQTLEQALAPEPVCIDERDLPKGCSLQRTEDYISREFYVFACVITRQNGVPRPTTKSIGRLLEGIRSIEAYRPRSGVSRCFTTTLDAVKYLVSGSGYSLKEIGEAFDAWDELALDF